MRKIKNYCLFHIKGLNQERFFSTLSKDFFVFDIDRYEKNKATFKVLLKDFKGVKKQILSSGYELLGQKRYGLLHNFFSVRKRYGLLAGVLLFSAFCSFCLFLPFQELIFSCSGYIPQRQEQASLRPDL